MSNTLLIFIKNPILGRVKSRLAVDIGEEKALAVYRDLLQKTRKEAEQLKGVRCRLYYSDFIDENDEWSDEFFEKRLQSNGDLGQKMHGAFRESMNEKTVIIGSDCFDLTNRHIEAAFQKLDESDVVLGPANDGGYYLLGMTNYFSQLFEGIEWSTNAVLKQTIRQAKSLNLKITFLAELVDLDTISDLEESGYQLNYKKYR
ncbi:MAG: TIGR04282 family arsenosugar biosynthesis glycosyltransferase [Vicingaceae bacterium]